MKFFTFKGKKYILKEIIDKKGNQELKLIPFDPKEYKKVLKEIISSLNKAIDSNKILEQALANLEYNQILAVRDSLKKGIKPIARGGCYYVNVGKEEVSIVD